MQIEIPDGAKVVGVIIVGDTNANKKVGAKMNLYADVPFDGTPEPKEVLDLPEWEPDSVQDLHELPGKIMSWLAPVASLIARYLPKKEE